MSTVRKSPGDVGTVSSALAAGGNPGNITTVEEWTKPAFTTKTITSS